MIYSGEHKHVLAERFGVTGLALFGSFARDQAPDRSDVDILVEFDTSPDWKTYFGAVAYLEDILGRPADMATISEVRKEIRPFSSKGTPSMSDPRRSGAPMGSGRLRGRPCMVR